MSQISTIYDAIGTVITTLFPTKKELSDPVIIENNDELTLQNGFGIYFGAAVNTNRIVGNQYSIERDVIVTLTKAMRGGHKDNAILKTNDKAMFEDQHILIKDFCSNNNIVLVSVNRNFISDTGITRIIGEYKTFFMIQTTFKIEYFESL